MSPVVSIQFFKVSQGKSDKYHLIISRHPAQSPPQTHFFLFLPVRLEGQGILLSALQMGQWRNWGEGSTLTRVKVGPRSGHKSATQSAGGCRTLSSKSSALSITRTIQLPLQCGVAQSRLSGWLQGVRVKMPLKAL